MSYNYKLTYKIKKHPKGIAKESVPDGFGACDAVLFCSMLYPPDGSFSVYFMGIDGRKDDEKRFENLEDNEWFKVWMLLASRLANSKTLTADKKNLASEVFEGMRSKLLGFSLN